MERVGARGRPGYRWKALGELFRSPSRPTEVHFIQNFESRACARCTPPLFDTPATCSPTALRGPCELRAMLLHRSQVPLLMCAARVVTLPPPLLTPRPPPSLQPSLCTDICRRAAIHCKRLRVGHGWRQMLMCMFVNVSRVQVSGPLVITTRHRLDHQSRPQPHRLPRRCC